MTSCWHKKRRKTYDEPIALAERFVHTFTTSHERGCRPCQGHRYGHRTRVPWAGVLSKTLLRTPKRGRLNTRGGLQRVQRNELLSQKVACARPHTKDLHRHVRHE